MIVCVNWGFFRRGLGLLLKGLRADIRQVYAEPYEDYMAISMGVLLPWVPQLSPSILPLTM